jgi:spore coat polysaccharide biosynthesis predicted glycosyltransferase SpsG
MGHFYRALNLLALFKERHVPHVLLVNDYPIALELLRKRGIGFETVLLDGPAGWEGALIRKHGIRTWIDDRLDTDAGHAGAVKAEGVRLVTFDDRGSGAPLADLHVAALAFDDGDRLAGARVLTGTRYLILDPAIERFRKVRTKVRSILVTLGGTDTYGVTVKVVGMLKELGRTATVILGPGFRHERELASALTPQFDVRRGVPSLIREFPAFDLAITGGGITAFEASASGLPCVVIANEWFEVPAARYLEREGCSVFAGHHGDLRAASLRLADDVEAMSRAGIAAITTRGVEHVYEALAAA